MTQETTQLRKTSNAYNIFILVLTILSLAVMVAMLMPLSDATLGLLRFYDNLICVIFLIDFYLNWRAASKKSGRTAEGRTLQGVKFTKDVVERSRWFKEFRK